MYLQVTGVVRLIRCARNVYQKISALELVVLVFVHIATTVILSNNSSNDDGTFYRSNNLSDIEFASFDYAVSETLVLEKYSALDISYKCGKELWSGN